MEKSKANTLNEKLQRFLELSSEFTVKSHEVYDGFQEQFTSISINAGCGGYYAIDSSQKEAQQPTKLEQFEIAQKEKIEKAKRYEEYISLQTDLKQYYSALNKIENN